MYNYSKNKEYTFNTFNKIIIYCFQLVKQSNFPMLISNLTV